MNRGIGVILLLMMSIAQLEATIFTPVDSTVVKKVELSNRFQNRIALREGRISQLVYPGCNLDINLDEEIGQVFIYALTNYPEPSSLTVITDGGKVQDFELVFVDKSGEIVILEDEVDQEIDFGDQEIKLVPGTTEYQVDIVQKIINRGTLEGFVCCNITPESYLIKKGVQAVLESKLVSLTETLYVWRIENVSKRAQDVAEKDVNFQCGNWVYLDQNHLCRGKKTFAIVGVKNETVR